MTGTGSHSGAFIRGICLHWRRRLQAGEILYEKAYADNHHMYSSDIGDYVCFCSLDYENLSINTSDRKSCSAGDPLAHGAGCYLLDDVIYAAEYSTGGG